jgi:hypothetical protein
MSKKSFLFSFVFIRVVENIFKLVGVGLQTPNLKVQTKSKR